MIHELFFLFQYKIHHHRQLPVTTTHYQTPATIVSEDLRQRQQYSQCFPPDPAPLQLITKIKLKINYTIWTSSFRNFFSFFFKIAKSKLQYINSNHGTQGPRVNLRTRSLNSPIYEKRKQNQQAHEQPNYNYAEYNRTLPQHQQLNHRCSTLKHQARLNTGPGHE